MFLITNYLSYMRNHKIKTLLITLLMLSFSQSSQAEKWDGKSPLWVGGDGCTEKIKFSVMDKMSTLDRYDIEYRVSFENEDNIQYISHKSYTDNSESADSLFPDDFYDFNFKNETGKIHAAPSPCITQKIFWSTYVNGKKISAGVIESHTTQIELNGKLISKRRK